VVKKSEPELFEPYDLLEKGSIGAIPWSPIEGQPIGAFHLVVRSVPNVPESNIVDVGDHEEICPFTSFV